MPNASTFDGVKGTDKREKKQILFDFFQAGVLSAKLKVRIHSGAGSTRRGCLSPLSHRGLDPLIAGLTRDLLRKWSFFMFFSLFRQRE